MLSKNRRRSARSLRVWSGPTPSSECSRWLSRICKLPEFNDFLIGGWIHPCKAIANSFSRTKPAHNTKPETSLLKANRQLIKVLVKNSPYKRPIAKLCGFITKWRRFYQQQDDVEGFIDGQPFLFLHCGVPRAIDYIIRVSLDLQMYRHTWSERPIKSVDGWNSCCIHLSIQMLYCARQWWYCRWVEHVPGAIRAGDNRAIVAELEISLPQKERKQLPGTIARSDD